MKNINYFSIRNKMNNNESKDEVPPKYEILENGEPVIIGEHTLHRIRALTDFGDVKRGDIGGWIEHESNLNQLGTCWVYDDDSYVYEEAKVINDATIHHSEIHGTAIVMGASCITRSNIYGNAAVLRSSPSINNSEVYGDATISGKPYISNAVIRDHADIGGSCRIIDGAEVRDHCKISGEVIIHGSIQGAVDISGSVVVGRGCFVCGTGSISENAKITGGARILGDNINISGNTRIGYGDNQDPWRD